MYEEDEVREADERDAAGVSDDPNDIAFTHTSSTPKAMISPSTLMTLAPVVSAKMTP
jgi:hypothetical protein